MPQKLDILNHVLSVIAEDPVTAVDSTLPTAQTIVASIDRLDRQTQSTAWWFNQDFDLLLNPLVSGEIIIPDDTLRITLPLNSVVVQRGKKLYDPVAHTYVFTAGIKADIVYKLALDDTPEMYSNYIMHKTAYNFYMNDDGDENKADRLYKEAMDAWTMLYRENLRQLNINVIRRPQVSALLSGLRQQGDNLNPNVIGGRS